jgi:hypothetical protein
VKPVRLWGGEVDRASPLGVGDAKLGGNYTAGLRATYGARERGFAEVLFLDSKEHKYIDESGSSNFFAITKDGRYVTPKSASILPSITNKSLMDVARDLKIPVDNRPVEVAELPNFAEAGLVGTATIITPVRHPAWQETDSIRRTERCRTGQHAAARYAARDPDRRCARSARLDARNSARLKKQLTLTCEVDSYRSGWSIVEFLAHRFPYHTREGWTKRVSDQWVRSTTDRVPNTSFRRATRRYTHPPRRTACRRPLTYPR